jgi:hypothetical protein
MPRNPGAHDRGEGAAGLACPHDRSLSSARVEKGIAR